MVKIHVVLQIACQRQRWHKDTPLCCYTWELKSLLFGSISDKKSNYKAFPQCDGTCDSSGHSFGWTMFDRSHNFMLEMASPHCGEGCECSRLWHWKNISHTFHNVSAWIFCFWWFCLPMSIYLVLLPLQIWVLKIAFFHCAFSNDFAKGLLVIQSHIGRI